VAVGANTVKRLMRSLRRSLRWPGALLAGAVLAWLAGLVWFVVTALAIGGDQASGTDAIVVLTGGRLRLESGIGLLGAGKGRKLFISGVNQRVDREDLMRVFEPVADRASCCIVLGHDSDNTYGNARETAHWMRQEGFASLLLVTSWYHMHRSLLEFRRAMPDVRIVAAPVFPHRDEPESAGAWLGAASLTVGEYNKFLAAWMRPAAQTVWPGMPWLGVADTTGEATVAATAPRR
jgi:uncharacterized SAM-binding protein YcdF (DUF218 family)